MSKDYIEVDTDLLNSLSFRNLSGSASFLYFQFLMKLEYKTIHDKSICTNNKKLIFDYENAEGIGYNSAKFNRALKQLVKYGLIDVVKKGGHSKDNYTIFALSNRWKNQDKKNKKSNKSGYIYVIKANDKYKIGKSKDVDLRLASYRASNSDDVELILSVKIKNYSIIETVIHGIFRSKRIKSEWFNLSDDDIETIRNILKENECVL